LNYDKELKSFANNAGVNEKDILRNRDAKGRSLSFTIDNPEKQKLRVLYPINTLAPFTPPSSLPENGKFVLKKLHKCFVRAGFIKEGMCKDLFWGFEMCGIDSLRTAKGLIDLLRAGYIKFRASDGSEVDENSNQLKECWIEYTPAMRGLFSC
jgi:hypothetical protein